MRKTQFNIEQPKKRRINLRILTQTKDQPDASRIVTSNTFRIDSLTSLGRRRSPRNISSLKKTGRISCITMRKPGDWITGSQNNAATHRIAAIQAQILESLFSGKVNEHILIPKLTAIFQVEEFIKQNFYSYSKVEKQFKLVNQLIKDIKSESLNFYSYSITGLLFFQYGNFSLSLYYFDQALKVLSKHKNYDFHPNLELSIYKTLAKLFMQIGSFGEAKQMAYMALRKAWKYRNIEQEMGGYDILGQIELEMGNLELSKYFHLKMCQGTHQGHDIVAMSNAELHKNQQESTEFTVYEDIMIFTFREKSIVGLLSNHYRSEAEQVITKIGPQVKHQFMYTHRSSNRVLRNHRKIQRKLFQQKQSKQLHFIKPKDVRKMRKVITQFSSFIFQVRRKCELSFKNQTRNAFRQSNGF